MFKIAMRSWRIYPLGFLFSLGFALEGMEPHHQSAFAFGCSPIFSVDELFASRAILAISLASKERNQCRR
jgi:hypothetical protein